MSDMSQGSNHAHHVPPTASHVHVRLRNTRLWLLLDHPPHNTLTVEMLEQLTALLQRATQQSTAQSVPSLFVITSAGENAFCDGIDTANTLGERYTRLTQAAAATCAALGTLRAKGIPTVALVKGSAFGAGCELLALCDTVIAREDAQFRLPAPNEHLFPCSVPTYLPAALGQETVTRLAEEQKTLSAREALSLGLVQQVLTTSRFHVDAEDLLVMLSSIAESAPPHHR